MITIKVYKNGYEIIGHAVEWICHQVSFWHWITSNLILGYDDEAREYTSNRDDKINPNAGYTWVIYHPEKNDLKWLVEDCIISLESWSKDHANQETNYWDNQVVIERLDDELVKIKV